MPRGRAETPSFRLGLQDDLLLLKDDSITLAQLRELASRRLVTLRSGVSYSVAKKIIKKNLTDRLDEIRGGRSVDDARPGQGSAAAAASISSTLPESPDSASPLLGHRLSYSAAVVQPSASRMTPLGKVPKPRTPLAPLTSPSASLQEGQGDRGEAPNAAQRAADANIPAQAAGSSSSDTISQLQQRLSDTEARVAVLTAELGRLQQQQRATHSQALAATQGLSSLQGAVERLQDGAAHSQRLQQDVSNLHSRQAQLAEQQQREECQRSVVLRTPEQLSNHQTAEHAEQLLRQKLGVQVTVLRAQQLGQHSPRSGSSSPRSGGVKATYKVVLANNAERDAVLRAKPKALRGSAISIDVLLTKQQMAKKQQLLPVAKSAAAAGRRVQWRYDMLYIDGTLHNGTASLPPRRQQQQREDSTTPVQPSHGTASLPPRRQQQQRQDSAAPVQPSSASPAVLPTEGEWVLPKAHSKKARQRQKQLVKEQQQQRQGSPSSSRGVSIDTQGVPVGTRVSVDTGAVSVDTLGVSVDTRAHSPPAAKAPAGLGKARRVRKTGGSGSTGSRSAAPSSPTSPPRA